MPNRFAPGCNCCCGCSNADVALVVDTTGSMGSYISTLKTLFRGLRKRFENGSCRWAVVDFKDFEDAGGGFGGEPDPEDEFYEFSLGAKFVQTFTSDWDLIEEALTKLVASGGGDGPEQNVAALKRVAEEWETTLEGRDGVKRRIIYGADVHGWEDGAKGYPYPSRQETIDALTAARVRVSALNPGGETTGMNGNSFGANIDPGQATDICEATGGRCFNGVDLESAEAVEKYLCRALR